jgi:hypothetical protein
MAESREMLELLPANRQFSHTPVRCEGCGSQAERGQTSRTRTRLPLCLISMLLSVALLPVGCATGDPYLDGLRGDPMADYEPPGAELVNTVEAREGVGFQDKPTHARIARTFRISDPLSAIQILEATVDYARSIGWDVKQSTITETLYNGTKQLHSRTATVSIGLGRPQPISEPEGPFKSIRIALEYAPRSSMNPDNVEIL